ncbi:MAG TPA: alpha hydrolase [Methanocorpusculum sp.]|nr:alpha hydrolase [Methanocorpusculum sp.]
MKAGVLYSGGKDSSLAAVLLSRDYDVELITFVFDEKHAVPSIEAAANELGFPWRKLVFAPGFLDEIIEMIVCDGHPSNAIDEIHRRSLCAAAQEYEVVADGTRRDDRVPMRTKSEVQSLEMKYGVSYIRPLLGIGKKEILRLADKFFEIAYGETGTIANGDYESEIRAEMAFRGIDYASMFPENHEQSLITKRKMVNQP